MLTTIAPAPAKNNSKTSVLGMNSVNMQPQQNSGLNKKKYTYTNMPFGQQPVSVARRNARERNRVKQVNNGFVTLRQHIPQTIVQALSNGGRGPHKKLSKVDTLRLAVEYIRRLQDLVDPEGIDMKTTSSSDYSNSTFDQMLASPSSETSSYYTASPEPMHHNSQPIYSTPTSSQQILLQNTSLESQHNHSETSNSPAPSYISEASSLSPSASMPNYGYSIAASTAHATNLSTPVKATSAVGISGLNYSVNQFKYEPYDDYSSIHHQHHNQHHYQANNNQSVIVETATTSEDEDLLDYISMWQEEQQ